MVKILTSLTLFFHPDDMS